MPRPEVVPLIVGVLAAIDFHHQPQLAAEKIADVGADRHLPAEFRASALPSAEPAPQASFGFGRIGAQLLGAQCGAADEPLMKEAIV